MATTVTALAGRDMNSWFFLAVDLAGGKSMLDVARTAIDAGGGTLVGSVRTPVNSSDFSSFLLQAMTSGAKTVGVIEGGADLILALKQAQEFGLTRGGQKLAVGFAQLSDIRAVGLELGQGLVFTEAFYWDLSEGKREFAKRFAARNSGNYPTSVQAGAYSAVFHYLKAVESAQSDDGQTVISRMKEMRVTDPLFGPGIVRPDGRMVHDMYLVEVKKPEESHGVWDFYNVLQKVPGERAFRAASPSCPLVTDQR
jgi:branched-chain amino acid transport system substrate-binding protein